MEQYIKKAATLVAELTKRAKHNSTRAELDRSAFMAGRAEEDKDILAFLDTIEVKEVEEIEDLEEAAKNVGQEYFPNENNIWARPNYEAIAAANAFKEGAKWYKEQLKDK